MSKKKDSNRLGGDPVNNSWMGGCFISTLLFAFALAVLMCWLTSCSPRIVETIVEKEKIVYRDSIAWRDSLLKVPIPLEKGQAIVAVNDTSRLETSVAESIAFVDSLGHLNHSLENKRTHLVAPIKIPTHYIYNGVTHTKVETLTKIEYVEKQLNWWQKFRIGAFWWLIILCVIGFRREIIAIIKKIL